jgi:hypothetical protein
VPVGEGLTIRQLQEFAESLLSVKKYLPDPDEWVHVDRKWLCDIVFTKETEAFQGYIDGCLSKRVK